MADTLIRFKPITTEDLFKGIDKTYSTAKTAVGGPSGGTTGDEQVTWYYVERTNEDNNWSSLTNDLKNLFHSFGIAREDEDDWFKVFKVQDWYNAKRMVIASIPQSGCGTYIDGSSLRINVPIGTGITEYVTMYGSTFNGHPDPITGKQLAMEYEDTIYGGAYCYLFGTTNNTSGVGNLPADSYGTYGNVHPYTGTVNGGINPNSGVRDFDPDEETLSVGGDAETAKSAHYGATHWMNGDQGRDVPYGIAFLERGIFVIFDMYGRDDLISNSLLSSSTLWNSTVATLHATTSTGSSVVANTNDANRTMVHFEGAYTATNTKIFYRTITQEYKTVYFCHAGQGEFNSTSNHTYNHKKAYFRPEESDSLWITEIGLYDDDDEMLAYAKLSEPVEKNKLETMTFKVELQL